jgi:hypothetical protein
VVSISCWKEKSPPSSSTNNQSIIDSPRA